MLHSILSPQAGHSSRFKMATHVEMSTTRLTAVDQEASHDVPTQIRHQADHLRQQNTEYMASICSKHKMRGAKTSLLRRSM